MASSILRVTGPKAASGFDFVVATLPLAVGEYLVTAKADVLGSAEGQGCITRLVVGSHEDSAFSHHAAPGQAGDRETICLVVGVKLTTPTPARLLCQVGFGRVILDHIMISATQVQNLSLVEEPGDPVPPPPPESVGS
jgi:hypothetical protein